MRVADAEQVWLPLVDEPVGNIVARIQAEDPEIDRLVGSPHRILAFRTFAYIRVGILLGELLFDQDLAAEDADETWVEALLRDPRHHAALGREVRAVAEEIAADPRYADESPIGPDEARATGSGTSHGGSSPASDPSWGRLQTLRYARRLTKVGPPHGGSKRT